MEKGGLFMSDLFGINMLQQNERDWRMNAEIEAWRTTQQHLNEASFHEARKERDEEHRMRDAFES